MLTAPTSTPFNVLSNQSTIAHRPHSNTPLTILPFPLKLRVENIASPHSRYMIAYILAPFSNSIHIPPSKRGSQLPLRSQLHTYRTSRSIQPTFPGLIRQSHQRNCSSSPGPHVRRTKASNTYRSVRPSMKAGLTESDAEIDHNAPAERLLHKIDQPSCSTRRGEEGFGLNPASGFQERLTPSIFLTGILINRIYAEEVGFLVDVWAVGNAMVRWEDAEVM